jgi:hypothetical protein
MAVLNMNESLLSVLVMLKHKQALLKSEVELGLCDDWSRELRQYIFALPKSIFHNVGLKRNEQCIRAIESLRIPGEWLTTESDKLSFYRFGF